MINQRLVVSSPDRNKALSYLSECLQPSLLVQQLGTAFPEQGNITLVTASDPPFDLDYFSDWGGDSCSEWLIDEVVAYLQQSPQSVVLFEDIVSSPSDPYLSTREHPAYWCFEARVIWPVTSTTPTHNAVEQAMAWSAGMRTIAIFSALPNDVALPSSCYSLSQLEFQQLGSRIKRIITTVFDGGGYLIWERGG